ncbi:neural cell adhesion molecule L1-like protein, partial [Rhinophrynus dorsalis]
MECEAKGNPDPLYYWTRNGHPFDPSTDLRVKTKKNSGTFTVKPNGNIWSYNGTYQCYASNSLGTAISEETTLIVPDEPTFPNEELAALEVREGDSVVLRCNPPSGIPPVHIYWMTLDLLHIPQDERVSVGLDGNLYFSDVKRTDSRPDYCCFAAFPSIRTIVQKMPMTLEVQSSDIVKERMPKMLSPHSGTSGPVTVLKGEALTLECIPEGLPTPKIIWQKEKGELPSGRTMRENHGKLLKIKDMSGIDDGIYRCVAQNSVGSVHQDFHILVEEPPRWMEEPKSGVFNVGSSVVLHCSASGKPDPVIHWKRNGIALEQGKFQENHRLMAEELIILNVQESDSAVYQCEARNKHGTILSSASINVLDIAPLILTPDNTQYMAVRGHSAFLHCEFFAFPHADVIWNREESIVKLSSSRFSLYENGTLQITETEMQDSGAYTCWVSNARGKTAINANLRLLEPTKVFLLPENPWVKHSQSITLSCHVQCDPILLPSLRISWGRNGEELNEGDHRIHLHLDTLFISNVMWEDGGIYTCTGHTSMDHAMAVTHLSVRDVPSPPEGLHMTEKLKRSVRLSWTASDDHNSPVSEFIVQAKKVGQDPGQWEDLIRVVGNISSTVLPLVPSLRYRFRVVAINQLGRSLPSYASETYHVPSAAPDKNPRVLYTEADKPNELTIKWEPLHLEEHNGPGLEYKVSWRLKGVETAWHHEKVKHHKFILKNTPTFSPYEISVQAINEMGPGPEPKIHIRHSGEDTPDASPSDVEVEVLNSSVVKVSWTTIAQDRMRGHLSGYKIIYWEVRSMTEGIVHHSTEQHVLAFPGQRSWGMIPGLDPFSEYWVSVAAFNTRGDGPPSTPVTFKTPEGVPEKPTFLRIQSSDKDSLTLTWGPPRKHNGILTNYLLHHQIINGTDEIQTLRNINITDPSLVSWRIPQLHGGTKYKFYLQACTTQGCSGAVTEEGLTVTQSEHRKDPDIPNSSTGFINDQPLGRGFTPQVTIRSQGGNNGIAEDVIEKRGT